MLLPSSAFLFSLLLFGTQVSVSLGAVDDPSWAFRQERSTTCEQLLNLALDINVNVFDDYPTAVQTAILLTQMPTSVSVADVTLISSVFLRDIEMQIAEQAYLCETEPDGICKRLASMTSSWSSDPLALLSAETKEKFTGKYTNEAVETVVLPFLKKVLQRTRFLLKNNCQFTEEKQIEPLRIS
uniref:Secreted protein n=1 Tax=Steinernema glaseri TaxID=37863 RepID=A0A1I7YNI7_9BILA